MQLMNKPPTDWLMENALVLEFLFVFDTLRMNFFSTREKKITSNKFFCIFFFFQKTNILVQLVFNAHCTIIENVASFVVSVAVRSGCR